MSSDHRSAMRIQFISVFSESDFDHALNIIKRAFATVATEYGLTRKNCPANPAFMEMDKLRSLKTEKTELYLLLADSTPAGFVAIEQSAGDPWLFYIEKLAVLPEYRHHKLGEQLMVFAESEIVMRGGKQISLGIIEENEPLKNWYKYLGYKENGTKVFEHLPFTVGFLLKELG